MVLASDLNCDGEHLHMQPRTYPIFSEILANYGAFTNCAKDILVI
jgi:hypothetical protein